MEHILTSPIGTGRTAEVYEWKPGWVVKLFYDWVPADWVYYEAKIATAVHSVGANVPAVGEVVDVKKRKGILFERVDGISLLEILKSKPLKAASNGRLMAKHHYEYQIKTEHSDLPTQKDRLREKINNTPLLTQEIKESVFRLLDKQPSGNMLCHNDFHPDNMIMTSKGLVIIDCMDTAMGNPLADVARTFLMLKMGAPANAGKFTLWVIEKSRAVIYKSYMKQYCKLRPVDKEEFDLWYLIIAAARLSDNIEGEEFQLKKIITEGLEKRTEDLA